MNFFFVSGKQNEMCGKKSLNSLAQKPAITRTGFKGQMNQIFDILSFAILKQPNAKRTHY